jgi:hypothetical protein
MGLKDDRKSQPPSLTTHNATDDDVSLASFGLPLLKVADLTESDANLLASVYRVTNKTVAHLTSNSGHPQILPNTTPPAVTLYAIEGAFVISILTIELSLGLFLFHASPRLYAHFYTRLKSKPKVTASR